MCDLPDVPLQALYYEKSSALRHVGTINEDIIMIGSNLRTGRYILHDFVVTNYYCSFMYERPRALFRSERMYEIMRFKGHPI